MTKIVVVVDDEHKEIFEGDNIEADVSGVSTSDLLRIWDATDKDNYKELASFKHWTYWRYTD